jgi:hypothetical protein
MIEYTWKYKTPTITDATQFFRLFGVISFDEDTYDAMFRFVMKNIEHCDTLQPIT